MLTGQIRVIALSVCFGGAGQIWLGQTDFVRAEVCLVVAGLTLHAGLAQLAALFYPVHGWVVAAEGRGLHVPGFLVLVGQNPVGDSGGLHERAVLCSSCL